MPVQEEINYSLKIHKGLFYCVSQVWVHVCRNAEWSYESREPKKRNRRVSSAVCLMIVTS